MNDVRPLEPRWKKDALWLAIALILTAAVWLVGVRPVTAARERVALDRAYYVSAHQKLQGVQADVAAARDQLAVVEGQASRRMLKLEPVGRLNHRLAALNDLAGETKLRLDDLQPAKSFAGQRYDLLPVHVAGAGDFAGFVAFLRRLHAACPDVGVASFSVAGQPSSRTTPATFTVDLSWYTAASNSKVNRAEGK